MRKLVLFTALALCAFARATPTYDFSSVDILLQDSVAGMGGGCALLLIKDGEVIHRVAFGRYSTDTVVAVASASKLLSSGVIMSLKDDSLLSLDDTCARFLPLYTGDKAGITVRELFSHTAGMVTSSRVLSNDNITLTQAADSIAAIPQRAAPGTDFAYGGVSMQTAGRIAEVASGLSLPSGDCWETLFQRRIARPLGITTIDYQGLGLTHNPRIAGSARASMDDYGRYLQMLLNQGLYNGQRILSESSVVAMFRDQTRGVPITSTPYENYAYLDSSLPNTRYGIGVWRERVDSTDEVTELSCQGAFGFSPWLDLRRNLVGVLSVHNLLRNVMPTYWTMKKFIRKVIDSTASGIVVPTEESGRVIKWSSGLVSGSNIQFSLNRPGPTNLTVYGLEGRAVRTLVNANIPAGEHSLTWDCCDRIGRLVPAGVYVIRLTTTDGISTAKFVVTR